MELSWTSPHSLLIEFYIAYGYRNNTVFRSCLDNFWKWCNKTASNLGSKISELCVETPMTYFQWMFFRSTIYIKVYTLEAKTSSANIFVGKNFRHLTKISSLFADEVFTDKVIVFVDLCQLSQDVGHLTKYKKKTNEYVRHALIQHGE